MLSGNGMVKDAFWVETTGSILSMVRVGTGQIDAYFDLMLGHKPYDFAAGAHFAATAGATVTSEDGMPLSWTSDQNKRVKFIIASTPELNHQIIQANKIGTK